jgi:hypothetical protein
VLDAAVPGGFHQPATTSLFSAFDQIILSLKSPEVTLGRQANADVVAKWCHK